MIKERIDELIDSIGFKETSLGEGQGKIVTGAVMLCADVASEGKSDEELRESLRRDLRAHMYGPIVNRLREVRDRLDACELRELVEDIIKDIGYE